MADKDYKRIMVNDVFAVVVHNKAGNNAQIFLKEIKMTTKQYREYEKIAHEYYVRRKEGKEQIAEIEEELNTREQKVKEFLLQCENKKHVDETVGFSMKFVEPQKPVFNAEKLEKSIPVDVSLKVIKKKFAVKNEVLFVALMRRYGVSVDELNECLLLEKEVDQKALEQALALGEIDLDMIDGTYTIEKKKAYIKVTEKI